MESTRFAELSEFAQQTVQMAGRTMGLSAGGRGEVVDLGVAGLVARPVILNVEEQKAGARVTLGIELTAPHCLRVETLRNSVTGVGRSPEEAVLQGVQVLMESGLPPVLAGLAEPPATPRWSGQTSTPDGAGQVAWEAYDGPLEVLGKERARLLAQLTESPPFAVYGSAAAFGERPLAWLQTSMVRGDDGSVSCNCVLNGRPWGEAWRYLRQMRFPEGGGLLFFRQFHLIRARLL